MLLYGTFTTLSSIPLPNPVSPHPASPPPRPIPRTLLNPPTALPVIYTSVAMSCIRSLSVLRLPPTPHHLGSDAVYVVTGAYDGSTKIVDVRDPLVPIPLDRQRCKSRSFSPSFFFFRLMLTRAIHTHTHTVPIMSTAWSTYFPGPIVGDNQYTAQVVRVADRKGRSRGFVISGHRGVIWVGSFFLPPYLFVLTGRGGW